jgi:PilZ domain-containing protein
MHESDNRRSSQRRRTVLTGKVLFNNRASVFDCTVRDLSDTGAQLTLADVSALPPEFELEIPGKCLQVQARLIGLGVKTMASGSIRRLTEQPAPGHSRSQQTSKSGAPVSALLQPPRQKQDTVVVSRMEERGGSLSLRPKRLGYVPGRFSFQDHPAAGITLPGFRSAGIEHLLLRPGSCAAVVRV